VLDRCRELYNAGLQERRDAYEMGVKRHPNYYDEEARKQLTREHAIGYYEQKRELVEIKEERPEYQDIASHVLQDVILRLKGAYDDFFRRVQNGEQPGYPRFQGRARCDSFTYPDGAGWKLDTKERPAGKICPNCRTIRKKTLEERWHSCACGCELDRDTASAKVILDLGHKQLFGRDAANADNGVEASGQRPEVRSQDRTKANAPVKSCSMRV
jgi:transposase